MLKRSRGGSFLPRTKANDFSLATFFVYAIALMMVTEGERECAGGRRRALSVGYVSVGVTGEVNCPAIFSNMTSSIRENVVVLDPSPKINEPSIVLAIFNLLRRDRLPTGAIPPWSSNFGGMVPLEILISMGANA